tara:strand:- start:81 stop:1169 length:1089 start_codon:yes stop_codon:yes gene_type:complete
MSSIPLFKVYNPGNLGKKVNEVYKTGIITEGKYTEEFERKFSKYIGNKNTVIVNSGTSALTLAYRLIGIKANDEVLVTAQTCMATNQPLDILGAKLKFVDINKFTGNVDEVDLEKKISKKTKAMCFVHWAGQPFNIKRINQLARKYNIPVIEDAAHAIGAKYNGKLIGNHGNYVVFSFQAIKHLSSVDGGALICPNYKITDRAKKLRWFGLNRSYKGSKWKQQITESGYKFHMNNVIAAIGIENIKHLKNIVNKHKFNGKFFDEKIRNPKIKLIERYNSETSYWIYSLLVDNKAKFKKYMKNYNIDCDEVHIRNDKYTVFKKYRNAKLLGTSYFEKHMINIPVGWWLKKSELKKIVRVINNY